MKRIEYSGGNRLDTSPLEEDQLPPRDPGRYFFGALVSTSLKRRLLFDGLMTWNGERRPFAVREIGPGSYEVSVGIHRYPWRIDGVPDAEKVRKRLADENRATEIDFIGTTSTNAAEV